MPPRVSPPLSMRGNVLQTGVSGGLVVLSSLTALDTLALKGTKVRPAAVDRLRTLLPRLRTQ